MSGAGRPFDGMPQRRNAAAVSGDDRISALPEALLLHTLSLLPSEEAVRTCVLAGRWRNLWKHTPSLRLIQDDESFRSEEHFNKFVSHLIVLRDRSPLVSCEIDLHPVGRQPCPYVQAVQLWIQYALACQVKELRVTDYSGDHRLLLNVPFISRHLTVLNLQCVILKCSMDFSSCPVLEDLKLAYCLIYAHKMSSKSLKRLHLTHCYFPDEVRTRISVPGLLSLILKDCNYRTPLLESMPFLETAFIRLDINCEDDCDYSHGICDKTDCCGCYGFDNHHNVLLNGVSNAINLELISAPQKYIFRRDVASCPIFGRLKTLLLNEWCATFEMYSLVRVLRRTPILEKLTLQIRNNKLQNIISPIGAEGNNVPTEQSFVCAQLKVANIECQELDEKVRKIWNILRTGGVHPDKIIIKIEQTTFLSLIPWL